LTSLAQPHRAMARPKQDVFIIYNELPT